MFKYNPYMLGLMIVSALASIYIGFLAFEPVEAIQVIRYGGYWLILAAFTLLTWNLFQSGKARGREVWLRRREWAVPAIYILVSSAIVLTLQPDGYKIVMDEPVLAATSLQMHQEKEILTAARGYEINGVFYLLGGYVDKRPYFSPFLTSLLHDLTGYRPQQGVVLNALLTPVFLSLLFVVGRLLARRWGGYLAVSLIATVPLMAMNANSGGFDLLNLVMLLGTALAAYSYLRAPNAQRMNTLILMGILLAQSRYESVLYVLAVSLVVGSIWLRKREIELTWVAIIAPLLLISFPLQRSIMNANDGFWQLEEGMGSPFSLNFIAGNLRSALSYFFANNLDQPNSLLVSVLFILSMVILPFLLLKRRFSLRLKHAGTMVYLVFALVVVANFTLFLAYYWGQMDDIQATRIGMPFILLQVVVIVTVFGALRLDRIAGPALAAVIAVFFVWMTRPLCARSDFLIWGVAQQQVEWIHQKAMELKGESVLFISDRHVIPLINLVSSIMVEDALAHKDSIELHQRLKTFSEVLVVTLVPSERANIDEHKILAEALEVNASLEEAFEMETIEEGKLNDAAYIRLARVTGVHLGDVEPIYFETSSISVSPSGRMDFKSEVAVQVFVRSLP